MYVNNDTDSTFSTHNITYIIYGFIGRAAIVCACSSITYSILQAKGGSVNQRILPAESWSSSINARTFSQGLITNTDQFNSLSSLEICDEMAKSQYL